MFKFPAKFGVSELQAVNTSPLVAYFQLVTIYIGLKWKLKKDKKTNKNKKQSKQPPKNQNQKRNKKKKKEKRKTKPLKTSIDDICILFIFM